MQSSEKRSLFRFLAIYLGSTFTLFILATIIFYGFQKQQIIDNQNAKLLVKSEEIIQSLRELSNTYDSKLIYPQYKNYHSSIYNLDKEYIFGTKEHKNIQWNKEYYQDENQLFYLRSLSPYYLDASKTLSRLYEDLTFLKLNHNYHRDVSPSESIRTLRRTHRVF